MSIFHKKKYYEAQFLANTATDSTKIDKEIVSILALDLAISKCFKEKGYTPLSKGAIELPQNHYGVDNLSTVENELLVAKAKQLIEHLEKGISIDTGIYSINIHKSAPKKDLSGTAEYRIKVMPKRNDMAFEQEAEAHSMMVSEKLGPFSKVHVLKNTLSDYWKLE